MKFLVIGIFLGAVLAQVGDMYSSSLMNIICQPHKPGPDGIAINAPAPEDK